MTLTEFLLARIAEDEESARAASPGGWHFGTVESVAGGSLYDETRMIGAVHYEQHDDHDGSIIRHLLSDEADANGAHIARHDPARVLAECEAKRRIVELAESNREAYGTHGVDVRKAAHDATDRAVRIVALPYADHPDYREEWRP